MKDAFGRKLNPGDQVVYLVRKGSTVYPRNLVVVESHDDYILTDWTVTNMFAGSTKVVRTKHARSLLLVKLEPLS